MNPDDEIYQDLLGKIDGTDHAIMLLVAVLEEKGGIDGAAYTQSLRKMFHDKKGTVRLDASHQMRGRLAEEIDAARMHRQSRLHQMKNPNHMTPAALEVDPAIQHLLEESIREAVDQTVSDSFVLPFLQLFRQLALALADSGALDLARFERQLEGEAQSLPTESHSRDLLLAAVSLLSLPPIGGAVH